VDEVPAGKTAEAGSSEGPSNNKEVEKNQEVSGKQLEPSHSIGEEESDGEELNCTIETIRPGDSTHYPTKGCTVRVHYEGFLARNNKLFDSSRQRGRPFEFKLGEMQVIQGWEEMIPRMSRGQIARVTIPSEKAYGITGYPPIIPPDSELIFEIELLAFVETLL